MASGSITSWQIDGATVADFIFLDSKIIADCDCSHEIKRLLLLGRKAMTNLDSLLKSRDTTDKDPYSQKYGFSLIYMEIYLCIWESWTIEKAERWSIDAFELWNCRRLSSPLDNKDIKPVNPKGN